MPDDAFTPRKAHPWGPKRRCAFASASATGPIHGQVFFIEIVKR
jgi:hypothetical protein